MIGVLVIPMRSGLNHFSAPPLPLTSDLLIHPVRYSTPLFTAPVVSPPPPFLHLHYRRIVCVLPPHAYRPHMYLHPLLTLRTPRTDMHTQPVTFEPPEATGSLPFMCI